MNEFLAILLMFVIGSFVGSFVVVGLLMFASNRLDKYARRNGP